MSRKRIERMLDDMSLFDDDLMSRVFDNNVPAAKLLLDVILGRNVDVKRSRGAGGT